MTPITIPKKLIRGGDLIVIPRKKYEELVRSSKKQAPVLDAGLQKALRDVREGKLLGPFRSFRTFKHSLER